MRVILASTSPYRRRLLERLGIPFGCIAPPVDEESFKTLNLAPRELAVQLAIEKAASVARIQPEAIVIGGDQLVALDDQVLGKPGTHERALQQLRSMSGRTHRLITAIAVVTQETVRPHIDETNLTLRNLSDAELDRYLKADQPYDCAGSYKIESRGITLFESIHSADHTAIEGLPLIALTSILREFGLAIP